MRSIPSVNQKKLKKFFANFQGQIRKIKTQWSISPVYTLLHAQILINLHSH